MSGSLLGKSALVTGASRGIGRAIAETLAREGAFVVGSYASNVKAADEAAAAIAAQGGKIVMVQADFLEPGSVGTLLTKLDAALLQGTGTLGLDILINNAGGGEYAFVAGTTEDIYDQCFARNTRAPFFLAKALMDRFRPGGSIINLSSEGARLSLSEYTAYCMAKSALESFTRCFAKEIGPRGVRVNAICPGIIRTAQSEDYLAIPERHKEIVDWTALRRIGHVDDIAGMVHALVTTAGAFVTGQIIEISGGYRL